MTRHPDRARENAVRRKARRQGLVLVKSRRRDPAASDYGRYTLADPMAGDRYDPGHVFGLGDDGLSGATLAECEMWLRSGAWPRLRRERARATATQVSKGDLAEYPRNDARSDARRPRSDARSDARRPRSDAPAPGVTPEATPGGVADLGMLGTAPRSRLPWRRPSGVVVASRPPDEDEETSVWDR